MAIQIRSRKKTKKVDFMQFLSGVPARDYVFQRTPYEEQIKEAAKLLREADALWESMKILPGAYKTSKAVWTRTDTERGADCDDR